MLSFACCSDFYTSVHNSAHSTVVIHSTGSTGITVKIFKVVDSCWISSTEWSDTFRSFLYMERSKNQEKKYIITVQKNFTFMRRFDRRNTVLGISRNLIDKLVLK